MRGKEPPRVLISACLTGENCKYNGGNNRAPALLERLAGCVLIPVCPERAGGLPCPRPAAEIVNGRVMNRRGEDVDAAFRAGADACLREALRSRADLAVLQPRSPSCGVTQVYDGSFSGTRIAGEGVFAARLREAGIPAADADDPAAVGRLLAEAEANALPSGLKAAVLARFERDSSGHDGAHTLRVLHLAERIARSEGARLLPVRLAALLHDVDDRKLPGSDPAGLSATRALMEGFGVDDALQAEVCGIIRQVSFKGRDSVRPDSLEGCCVQDADRLDAIGAIGIARAFAYGGSRGRRLHDPAAMPRPGMDAAAYAAAEGTTINHFHEKLLLLKDLMTTPAARRLAGDRHRYLEGFLAEFLAEWDGER